MELRHLRYFLAVADTLNFRAAAEQLHIAQPSLSQQIRSLEADVGVQLLVRTTRRVELTAAGTVFRTRVAAILDDLRGASAEAVRADVGEVGRLSVGFTGSSTYELLPMLARSFRERFPDVDLTLRGEMLTPDQVDGLVQGDLDVGFLRPPVSAVELEVEILRRERLIAILPEGHRYSGQSAVRLENLAGEPFITYPSHWRSVMYTTVDEACAQAGFRPRIVQEVQETSTLVNFVAAGVGIAIVPESVRHVHVTGVSYLPLTGTSSEIELALAWHRSNHSPTLKRFLELVRALIGPRALPVRAITQDLPTP